MSWPAARAALVALIEGTPTTTTRDGAPKKFKYADEASPALLPEDRGFFFMLPEEMAMSGELTVGGALPRWIRWNDLPVRFVYSLLEDYEGLLEILAADHEALCERVPNPNLWNQPDSTIESLFLGAETIARFKIKVEGGKVLADFTISIEFKTT